MSKQAKAREGVTPPSPSGRTEPPPAPPKGTRPIEVLGMKVEFDPSLPPDVIRVRGATTVRITRVGESTPPVSVFFGPVSHLVSRADMVTLCGEPRDQIIQPDATAPMCRACFESIAPIVRAAWDAVHSITAKMQASS